jgi:hypothetical protein
MEITILGVVVVVCIIVYCIVSSLPSLSPVKSLELKPATVPPESTSTVWSEDRKRYVIDDSGKKIPLSAITKKIPVDDGKMPEVPGAEQDNFNLPATLKTILPVYKEKTPVALTDEIKPNFTSTKNLVLPKRVKAHVPHVKKMVSVKVIGLCPGKKMEVCRGEKHYKLSTRLFYTLVFQGGYRSFVV